MLSIRKNEMYKKYFLIIAISCLCFTSCEKQIEKEPKTTTITEIQEIEKPVDEIIETVKDLKPNEIIKSDEELIRNTLLKYFNEQFGNTDAPYKTTGFKMYLIESISPTEKKAYGYANYMEYNYENGELVNTAGSGPTGIALTFSNDESKSHIDYEILTDKDHSSKAFKEAFPESIHDKFINRSQDDIAEVIKNQETMLNELINK